MGHITLIIGGARSGKSREAVRLAGEKKKKTAFIATCQPLDAEMQKRVLLHKKNRPKGWKTFEEPLDLATQVKKIGNAFDIILIDCLTLWVSNLLLGRSSASNIIKETEKVLSALKKTKADTIIVSNEVGLGIVPTNALAREFRDIAGSVNQAVAKKADRLLFMVAGIPLEIKNE